MASSFKGLILTGTDSLNLPSGTNANRTNPTTTIVQWTNTGSQAVSTLAGSATTTSTSWTCPAGVTSIEVLVVAGGGGGGAPGGGGGGGGGLIYNSTFKVIPTTSYTVAVGAGGAAGVYNSSPGGTGGNSSFSTLLAYGGGGGGGNGVNATNGGSGGGTGGNGGPPGTGRAGQGFTGGLRNSQNLAYGGGGGAGGPGQTAADSPAGFAGNGGAGLQYSISGTPTYYAGGGGAGAYNTGGATGVGIGGAGGGGIGSFTSVVPGNGVANTGGGGGGTGGGSGNGGTGGSGIVIIRYNVTALTTLPTGQLRFNTVTNTVESFDQKNLWNQGALGTRIAVGENINVDGLRYGSGTTWYDISEATNNVTLTNSPTYNSAGYFTFNGTTQYAANANFTGHKSDSFTVMGWARLTATANDQYIASFAVNGGGVNGASRGIRCVSGYWSAVGYGDGSSHDYNPSSAFAAARANIWQHVAAVYNGTTVTLYVDGRAVQATRTGLVTPTTNGIQIGRAIWSGSSYLAGDIANVTAFGKALSGAEIIATYNAQSGRFNKGQLSGVGMTADTAAGSPADLRAAGITSSGVYWYRCTNGTGNAFQAYTIMGRDGDWVKVAQFYNATSLATTAAVNAGGTWIDSEINLNQGGKIATADWTALNTSQSFLFRVRGGSDNLLNGGYGTGKLTYNKVLTAYGTDLDPTDSYILSLDQTSTGTYEYSATYTNDSQGRCNHTTNYWISDHNYNGTFTSQQQPPANSIPICWTIGTDRAVTNLHWMSGRSAQSSGSINWGNDSGSSWAIYVK